MKKLFTTFFLVYTLFVVNSAQGALLVPGNVPTTSPLQPIPLNVAPNYSKNINDAQVEVQVGSEVAKEENQPAPQQSVIKTGPMEIPKYIIVLGVASLAVLAWLILRKQ